MDSPPLQPTAKLRLMCSYGGQIVPRPGTNSLFYAGGDNRIVSIDLRAVTTLSALVSHLSSVLSLNFPFILKYQLPHLDLDSLISFSSDDDFLILLDEHHRLSLSSSNNSRIRVFVLPIHPPPADSILLETSSSCGSSSSSSASFTNFSSSDTFPSDYTVSSVMTHLQHQQNNSISYQDPVIHVRLDVESTKMPCNDSSGVVVNNNANTNMNTTMYSSIPQQFNLAEKPRLQFVRASSHFLPRHPTTHQIYQQNLVYYPNQACPVYLVPISCVRQASLNPNAASINSHIAHNNAPSSFVHVPCNGNQQREMDGYPMHIHQSQSQNVSITSRESTKYVENEVDDDGLARVQIYKSQPPPPAKYQTMTKATTNMLSEALAQLHLDNDLKQQLETSLPQ